MSEDCIHPLRGGGVLGLGAIGHHLTVVLAQRAQFPLIKEYT